MFSYYKQINTIILNSYQTLICIFLHLNLDYKLFLFSQSYLISLFINGFFYRERSEIQGMVFLVSKSDLRDLLYFLINWRTYSLIYRFRIIRQWHYLVGISQVMSRARTLDLTDQNNIQYTSNHYPCLLFWSISGDIS